MTAVKDFMLIGTFSNNGPTKCSGLEIKQYNQKLLVDTFSAGFSKLDSVVEDHTTPFNTTQNFVFCSFQKK